MFYLQKILLPGAILVTLYVTFFAMRALRQFGLTLPTWGKWLTGLGAAVVVALCTVNRGVGTILLLHLVVLDALLRLVGLLFRKKGAKVWGRLWGSGALTLLLATVIVLYGYVNMYTIRQTDYTLYTDKDIREEGYRVVLVADVHYGVSLRDEQLQAACDRISAENTDMVILCGDIVDENTTKEQMEACFRIFGSIQSRYGVFYIYGNHDRSLPGSTHSFTPEELEENIISNGITIVRDEVLPITEEFLLVGREDEGYSGFPNDRLSAAELVEGVSQESFLLFAEHKPVSYGENAAAGADLILSGHTHGGQMWPINLFMAITATNDNLYGSMAYTDATTGIVTSGLACWGFDVKNAAPSEYVVVTILPE